MEHTQQSGLSSDRDFYALYPRQSHSHRVCSKALPGLFLKRRKAFTLIELIIAIGILIIVLSFAGVIFNTSIKTYHIARANAEIMTNLRAITDWLDADFEGIIQTYPGRIVVETKADINADCIAFLATGNFQSIRQYNGRIVEGIAASIFYGQAKDPFASDPKAKILTRIQTILTSDYSLPNSSSRDEYYKYSLAEWKAKIPFLDVNDWSARPTLDIHSEKDLVMYMAKGVDNFTIEWFGGIDKTSKINWRRNTLGSPSINTKALKFTFTLYDSNDIIKQGRTFTHIVYLDEPLIWLISTN